MKQLSYNLLKPSLWRLFKTLEGFMKTHMLRKNRINVTLRLGHIDLFFKNPMQKCITNIKLSQLQLLLTAKAKRSLTIAGLNTGLNVSS